MGKVTDEQKATAEKVLPIAAGMIDAARAAIASHEKFIREAEAEVRKFELTAKGVGPCDKCGRHVLSPCDNGEGYHESGPWDFACRDYFYPEVSL